ncbi:hypothetical protein INR49_010302 [Caranx melampygus]|nr:hypothetical protein INR49_010302 [Caranx melampygus]
MKTSSQEAVEGRRGARVKGRAPRVRDQILTFLLLLLWSHESSVDRVLKIISGHLCPPPSPDHRPVLRRADCGSESGSAGSRDPDDVVVVHGRRTAIGRAKRGSFKDTTPDELLSAVMTAVLKDVGLSPDQLGDVCVGNVLQPGAGALMARVAHFLSGFPDSVPVYTVNRQCSSGLQALLNIAGAIRSKSIDLGLACGVESMSLRSIGNPGDLSSRLADVDKARDCVIPMGEQQDAFALASQQKAACAQASGLFDQEIVPVRTRLQEEGGAEREVTVQRDEGVRPGTSLDGLRRLRPAFKADGSTTAGNSSQVSDGAAAVLVGRRAAVEALGLPVLGVLRSSAVVGVPPDVMGIGPAFAIPVALERAGLTIDDIDVVTLLHELRRRGRRAYGVVSMCIGTGMGAAAVFEYPGP